MASLNFPETRLCSPSENRSASRNRVGAPTGSGETHFHLDSGQVRPHVLGTLHLNDADGTCARMRLRHFNDSGTQIAERFGGTVCANDDAHHESSRRCTSARPGAD
jgi:hypothetical protein